MRISFIADGPKAEDLFVLTDGQLPQIGTFVLINSTYDKTRPPRRFKVVRVQITYNYIFDQEQGDYEMIEGVAYVRSG